MVDRVLRALALAVVVAAALCGTVRAQDVTLEVKEMELADVAKLLEQAAGADIRVPRDVGLPVGITLNVENEPFKAVLRKVCEQAGCYYRRMGSGHSYYIYEGPFHESPYHQDFEGGFTVSVERVALTGPDVANDFSGGAVELDVKEPTASVVLQIEVLRDEDLVRLIDLEDLKTVDAEGRVLEIEGNPGIYVQRASVSTTYPDRVAETIKCGLRAARGGSITVSGTVLAYRTLEAVDFRFDDLENPLQTVTIDDKTVTMRDVAVTERSVSFNMDVEGFPKPSYGRRRAGEVPPDVSWEVVDLVVLGETGREYTAHGKAYRGGATGVTLSSAYGAPKAVIVRAWRREDPSLRMPFEVKDVPLPSARDESTTEEIPIPQTEPAE